MENAYKSLQNVQNLLINPSAAASAVLNPNLNYAAQNFVKGRVASAAAARIMPGGGGKKMKSRRYLKDPKKFKTYISKLRNKTAKKEVELINSIRELKKMQ